MNFLKKALYVPKHEKLEDISDEALTHFIRTSLFGIFMCVICLAGLTWAWFTASVTTSSNTITAASYDVATTVTDGDSAEVTPVEGLYTLDPTKEYTVTVTKTGSAKNVFCHFSVALTQGGTHTVYITDLFPASGICTVTVSGFAEMTVTPMWGIPASPTVSSSDGILYNH